MSKRHIDTTSFRRHFNAYLTSKHTTNITIDHSKVQQIDKLKTTKR